MAQPDLIRSRLFAWLIDLAMMCGFVLLFGWFSWVVNTAYWLLRDGLFDGQSVGKRLMGLKVVVGQEGRACTYAASALRNVLWLIPVVNIAMGFTGLHYLLHDGQGRHWGDRLAETRVVRARREGEG